MRKSFPHKSEQERNQIEKQFYRNLFDVVVETIKAISINEKELQSLITHQNPDMCNHIIAKGESFVALAGHLGNWEWTLLGNALRINGTVDAVYKPLSSSFFDRLMLRIRGRFGIFPVPSTQLLRIEASRKHIPRAIAMVADQTPFPEGAYVTRFLNQDTLFFRGPVKIASMFQTHILYSGIRKIGRSRYELFVEELGKAPFDDQDEVLEKYARRLEQDILADPALWLWSHKRWKHDPAKAMRKAETLF